MWILSYRKLERLKVAIENFPKVDGKNEEELKELFLKAKKIIETNRLKGGSDYRIARSIFFFGLYRNYFYGWNPEEIINLGLIEKICPQKYGDDDKKDFLKKLLAHGRFKSKISEIIWLIRDVKTLGIWIDEETNFAELYFCSSKTSAYNNDFKISFPDKEDIEKLLKMASDPDDKKDLLGLVQDYKSEVIKKLASKKQGHLNEIEYIKNKTIPSIEEKVKQIEALNF